MVLETARLYLRRMDWSDYDSLCKILKDDEVMYAYNGAFSDKECVDWLEKQILRYEKTGFGLWAVTLKDREGMIGQCGLTIQPWKDKSVLEIGYLFQKAYWHKGYASEAAIACREYAFNSLDANEVFSIIRSTNVASQNVARRNGMTIVDFCVKHYRDCDMPHFLFGVKRRD